MKRQKFNDGWMFYKAGEEDKVKPVHLPHDAMREQKRVKGLQNGGYTGYFPSGDYCYEKIIYGEEAYQTQTMILEFEGVYMDSKVYLNGECIGGRVYGYSHFYVDLTGKLKTGKENILKVTVHCSQVPNARWYPGNGIYRPVYLWTGSTEYLPPECATIKTLSIKPARISVDVEAVKDTDTEVATDIYYKGKKVASGAGCHCEIDIADAKLWDESHPELYEAHICLKKDGNVIDRAIE